MRAWLLGGIALLALIAIADNVAAQETLYVHARDVPSGQLDNELGPLPHMDASPPAEPGGAYFDLASQNGNRVTAEFQSTDPITLVGGSIEVHFWALHPNPAADLCGEWTVGIEDGSTGNLVVSQIIFSALAPTPTEHVALFENVPFPDGNPLRITLGTNYADCDTAAFVFYDSVDFPTHVVLTKGNDPPVASLSASITTALAPADVVLTVEGSDSGPMDSWELYQDGDTIAAGDAADLPVDVDVLGLTPGEYQFSTLLVDASGAIDTAEVSVKVWPEISITVGGPYAVDQGFDISVEAFPSGGFPEEPITCEWASDIGGGSGCMITFNSDNVGTHTISVTATQGASSATTSTMLTINEVDQDVDDDQIPNSEDNCSATANPEQEDQDGDGIGDVCDADKDGDDISNGQDNCPDNANVGQGDLDGDGIGNACDPDRDGDSRANGVDNCPDHPNQTQADLDGDGLGDACDGDADGDGVQDGLDYFPDDADESDDVDRDGEGDNAQANAESTESVEEDDPVVTDDKESPGLALFALIGLLAFAARRARRD